MKLKALILADLVLSICLLSGCACQHANSYVEGTSLTVGLWLPINGQIYGLQALNYLSGKKISVSTNQEFKVESERNVTNSTLNVFDVIDNSKTRIGE